MVLLSIDTDTRRKFSDGLLQILEQMGEADIISVALHFRPLPDDPGNPCPKLGDFASRALHREAAMVWANTRNGHVFEFVRRMEELYPGQFRPETTGTIVLGWIIVDAFPEVIAALAQDPIVSGIAWADAEATLFEEHDWFLK